MIRIPAPASAVPTPRNDELGSGAGSSTGASRRPASTSRATETAATTRTSVRSGSIPIVTPSESRTAVVAQPPKKARPETRQDLPAPADEAEAVEQRVPDDRER